MGSDLKLGIPKSFQEFCQRAKLSTDLNDPQGEYFLTLTSKSGIPLTVNVLCSAFTEVTGQMIQCTQPLFSGIDLAVIAIRSKVSFFLYYSAR